MKFWAIDSTDDGVLDAVFIYGVASNNNKTYFYVKDAGDFETYDKNKTYKGAQRLRGRRAHCHSLHPERPHNVVNVNGKGVCVETTNGDGIVTSVSFIGTNNNGVKDTNFDTVKSVGSAASP